MITKAFVQASFKLRLAARDGACVVSEVDVELCVAAHIVPQSRPDVSSHVSWISLLQTMTHLDEHSDDPRIRPYNYVLTWTGISTSS
jgi:hypothetical protein